MSYGDIGKGVDALFRFMAVGLILSFPLALWKLWDIASWLWTHVSIGVTP